MRHPWKPARGYRTAIRNTSWWRNNHNGTITAVAVVPPKDRPALDGGTWTRYELWTVQLPLAPGDVTRMSPWWRPWRRYWMAPGPVYMLNDKPWRITSWDEDHPDRRVLARKPVPSKLAKRLIAEDLKHMLDDEGRY